MAFTRHLFSRFMCTTLLLALFPLLSQAKEPLSASAIAPMTFAHITINEGLPSNTVRSLLQDKYGFIWIGTNKGVVKFDGHSVTKIASTRSMVITAMCERNDTIWIGTENGLFFYCQETGHLDYVEINQNRMIFSSINVMDIAKDKAGNLWIATMNSGIIRIGKNGAKQIPTPYNDKDYGRIVVDCNGDIWATTNWARIPLIKYDKKQKRFIPYHLNLSQDTHYISLALTCGEDKHMWMACSNGTIIRFSPTTHEAQVLLEEKDSPIRLAHSITEVGNGIFLIGSDAGLTRYSFANNTTTHYTRSSAGIRNISDNFIYPIMIDHEGGVWIGTYYGGVNYAHPSHDQFLQFIHSESFNSVSGNVINNFCEDKYNRIWIASDDGGLTLYNPSKNIFIPIDLSNGNGDIHNVHALCPKGDYVIAGTYSQGINIVNINTLKVTNIPNIQDKDGNVIDNSSYAMLYDRDSCLWVGTFVGICIYDENTNAFKLEKNTGSNVSKIIQTKDGTIWFATEGSGIYSYNKKKNKWTHYSLTDSPAVDATYCSIYEDENGTIWAGSSDALYRFDKKANAFNIVNLGISPISILGITSCGGSLWLTTEAGLRSYSLTKNKMEQAYEGSRNLTTKDFINNAILCTHNNDIYIGTTGGFTRFSPKKLFQHTMHPHITFTGIEVNSHPVELGSNILPKSLNHAKEIRLSHEENAIKVHFSAMSYIMPTNNEYELYLEGLEEEWIPIRNEHSVSYTNLKPGTYVLHVRCSNVDANTPSESTLKIVITPPFYWNTYSQILYIIIMCIIAYFLIKRYSKNIKKRHAAEIESLTTQKQQEIESINTQKIQEIEQINSQKLQEIEQINTEKEREIKQINIKKEIEVHDARIKFMRITQKDQEFLDNVEKILQKNYSNSEFTIEDLANQLGISRTGLFTKLKALADVTPNEMLQIIRLKHAAELLSQKQYRVNEVCYMVGFSSPSYFAKCFQKQYGVTPAKYDR